MNQLLNFYMCNHCIKYNQETTQTAQTIYQAYSQATYYMSLLAIKKSYMRNCLGLRADPLYPFFKLMIYHLTEIGGRTFTFVSYALVYSDKLYTVLREKMKNEQSLRLSRWHSDTVVPTQTKSQIPEWSFRHYLIP